MLASSASAAASSLIGREAETRRLDAMLDGLRERGGALVVRGEPGIGKSALLGHVRRRAGDLGARTLVTVGAESEAELAFAGLHQLLRPISERLESLPDPQRRAVEAAFGLTDEVDPDPFRVALATHELVCEAARSEPLVVLVDDAQWLDRSSLWVLTFMARRLEGEPVALVAAVRDGYETSLDEARLPSLQVERLTASAAAQLLDRTAPDLHSLVRARVLAAAAGNPLALVELAAPAHDESRFASAPATLTARLERAFAARLDELPIETREALLAAALDARSSLDDVALSAGVPVSALDPAVAVGLVDIVDGEVRFRHPLVRSAIEQHASPAQVLATYAALAEVVDDPERRLWHRAMAAVGHDEDVADALDAHARVARRRGAVTGAAAALERAAALTADPQKQGERLVRAAELAYELGLVDLVRRLLGQAEPLDVGDLAAARLAWLREMVDGDMWFESGTAKRFVRIAERIRDGGDPDMALRSLVPAAHRCWWTPVRTATRKYLVDAAERVGADEHDPRLLAVLALADPEETGPSVLRRVAARGVHDVGGPVAVMHVGIAAEKAGDLLVGSRFLARAAEGLRDQFRLGVLTQALVHQAWAATHIGEWDVAATAAGEAVRLARDTGQPPYELTGRLIAGLVMALRGHEPDLEMPVNRGPLLAPAHLARAAVALGEGRDDDAFRDLWPVFDERDPLFHRFMRWPAVLDLVEAAAHSEHTEQVAPVVAELEAIAARSEPPILRAGLICARPLTARDADAEPLFLAALDADLSGHPFLRARTLFSFGRWLHRQRRNADARVPLHAAIDVFDALGATRWAERARQELRATGEQIGSREAPARERLTAQELQIAQLAAKGLSNREIGERLFLSHRTIGSHLYRVFPKLGITSRAQLGAALARGAGS